MNTEFSMLIIHAGLTVTGSFFVANAGDYGFNDIISSYLCYN